NSHLQINGYLSLFDPYPLLSLEEMALIYATAPLLIHTALAFDYYSLEIVKNNSLRIFLLYSI
ncbi:hypothetical protein, partial [Legionella londiniensis]